MSRGISLIELVNINPSKNSLDKNKKYNNLQRKLEHFRITFMQHRLYSIADVSATVRLLRCFEGKALQDFSVVKKLYYITKPCCISLK